MMANAAYRPINDHLPAVLFACPGTVQGFGQVTSSIVFSPIAPPVRTLTFADGSTLVLAEDEFISFRTPGRLADAPGAQVSFGHPFFLEVTWVVVGGTGVFAGASGSRTQIVQANRSLSLMSRAERSPNAASSPRRRHSRTDPLFCRGPR